MSGHISEYTIMQCIYYYHSTLICHEFVLSVDAANISIEKEALANAGKYLKREISERVSKEQFLRGTKPQYRSAFEEAILELELLSI